MATVVRLKTGSAEATQLFKQCYPGYSEDELKKLRAAVGTFQKIFVEDPGKVVEEARRTFGATLNNAFERIFKEGAPEGTPKVNPEHPPVKALAESLFYDEQRFSLRNGVSRIVIYSNMLQNSDQIPFPGGDSGAKGGPEKIAEAAQRAAEIFQTHFNRA